MAENKSWTYNESDRRQIPQPQTNMVGYSPSLEHPKWLRDDTVDTKSKRTLEYTGGRPCRPCGSPKHLNYEWELFIQGARRDRANLVNPSQEHMDAQKAYDKLYYASEDEDDPQLEEDN